MGLTMDERIERSWVIMEHISPLAANLSDNGYDLSNNYNMMIKSKKVMKKDFWNNKVFGGAIFDNTARMKDGKLLRRRNIPNPSLRGVHPRLEDGRRKSHWYAVR